MVVVLAGDDAIETWRRIASVSSKQRSMALPTLALESVSMSDLEALVPELAPTTDIIETMLRDHQMTDDCSANSNWVAFEAEVRSKAATAFGRLRAHGGERCAELLRLCELEEQTRCQAFQAAMMGEVGPAIYQSAVRSILEKLLAKLETYASAASAGPYVDMGFYQATAQCLSEYMSALNHHCEICAAPQRTPPAGLPAIAEEGSHAHQMDAHDERDYLDSSDYPSELGSEDAETLSVHSEPSLSSSFCPRHRAHSEPGSAIGALGVLPAGALGGGGAAGVGAASGMVPGVGGVGSLVGGVSIGGIGGGGHVHELDARSMDELRKERRREANKKASVKYRSRKANSMQQVLADVAAARQQAADLTSRNAVLTAENQLLKQQVAFLQGMLQSSGGAGGAGGGGGAGASLAAVGGAQCAAAPAGAAVPPEGSSGVVAALGASPPPSVPPMVMPSAPPPGAPVAAAPFAAAPFAAASAAPPATAPSSSTAALAMLSDGCEGALSSWLTADAHLRL